MRKGRGKSKGNNFERKICKQLSLWFTNGRDDNVFWRSTGSGARATVRSKKNKGPQKHGGDVCAIDPIGEHLLKRFAIELKCGYNSDSPFNCLDSLPSRKTPTAFESFVRQAGEAASQIGSNSWWLIWQRSGRRTMIYLPYPVLHPGIKIPRFKHIIIRTRNEHVVGTDLDLFLRLNSPEDVCSRN